MGRRGNWFGAVKRVFSPESKENKGQKKNKSKKRWRFVGCNHFDSDSLDGSTHNKPLPTSREKVNLKDHENDQSDHAYSVALASAVAAEAAAVAAQAAATVVRLTSLTKFSGRSKEEVAAIKIQTAFRGYLARRALRALRGLVRLKLLTNSNTVKRQAAATLRCMQTMARVQAQVRSRRMRMSEENQALQRQLQLKHEREIEKIRMSEEWDDSLQSKEQIEAHLQHKQEATVRRERALAYAFSHQWKSSTRSTNTTFMDPNNPHWGWSWMERWMAARPWENRNLSDRDLNNSDRASVKSSTHSITASEISTAYARRDTNLSSKSTTPPSKPPTAARKIQSASPRSRARAEGDSNSILSVQSEHTRRHSIAGSSVRDDESLGSTASVPSYMIPRQAVKVKSRYKSSPSSNKVDVFSEVGSVSSAKKRLSYPLTSNGGNRL